jgi:hypothetical protein
MVVRSRIDIAVNSAEFLALKTAFDRYENAIKKLPAAWQNVGRASSVAKTNFESAVSNMKIIGSSIAAITTSSKTFYDVTVSTSRYWKDIALSTKTVAGNIVSATDSLLKWTGIVGIITGAGGLFGYDRLAHSVASQRTAALSTGGQYGARQAFVTSFRRLGDPEGLLGRVAGAQTNIKESLLLRNLGVTDMEGDPTEIAIKALRGASRRIQQDKATGLPVGSDPLLKLLTTDERVRIRDHPEEVEEMIAHMRAVQKSGRLNLSPADQKAYQDFTTRMENASREIETVFVKGLIKLAGPLSELSDATVKLVDKFTDKALPAFIKDLAGSIDWLAKEVEKPSFVEKVEGIVGMVGSLASSFGVVLSGLARFARWLGISTAATGSGDAWRAGTPGVSSLTGAGGETSLEGRHGGGAARGRKRFGHPSGVGHAGHGGGGGHGGDSGGGGNAPEGSLRERGLRLMDKLIADGWTPESAAMAAGNAQAESNINASGPAGDAGASVGMFQDQGPRRTALRAFQARHPEMSKEDSNIEYYNQEKQQQAWKNLHDMSRAGEFSHATEGYGDNTEGKRVRMSNQWLREYRQSHAKNVSIHAAPGGNTNLSSGAAAAGSP